MQIVVDILVKKKMIILSIQPENKTVLSLVSYIDIMTSDENFNVICL